MLQKITEYSEEAIPNEAIGLLGGKEIRDKELLVTRIVLVTEGSEYSVAFSEEDFVSAVSARLPLPENPEDRLTVESLRTLV